MTKSGTAKSSIATENAISQGMERSYKKPSAALPRNHATP